MSNDTLERLRKVAPLNDHREFATVRLDLLTASRAEIESLELSWSNCSRACAKMQTERDAALLKLEASEKEREQFRAWAEPQIADRNELLARLDQALREVEGWKDSAAHFAKGQEFYRGVVRQVGALYGVEARTSDDGSIQDDVLALKVPELVAHYMEQAAQGAERENDALQRLADARHAFEHIEKHGGMDKYARNTLRQALIVETPARNLFGELKEGLEAIRDSGVEKRSPPSCCGDRYVDVMARVFECTQRPHHTGWHTDGSASWPPARNAAV